MTLQQKGTVADILPFVGVLAVFKCLYHILMFGWWHHSQVTFSLLLMVQSQFGNSRKPASHQGLDAVLVTSRSKNPKGKDILWRDNFVTRRLFSTAGWFELELVSCFHQTTNTSRQFCVINLTVYLTRDPSQDHGLIWTRQDDEISGCTPKFPSTHNSYVDNKSVVVVLLVI